MMDREELMRVVEEGALFAQLEEPKYILIGYVLHPNGTTSNGLIEDPQVAARIGLLTGLGAPTDPNGWAIWEVDQTPYVPKD